MATKNVVMKIMNSYAAWLNTHDFKYILDLNIGKFITKNRYNFDFNRLPIAKSICFFRYFSPTISIPREHLQYRRNLRYTQQKEMHQRKFRAINRRGRYKIDTRILKVLDIAWAARMTACTRNAT